jgi:3-isopropylmalate/(R)-2-methylmalate dehydratase large subunit
VLRGHKIHPEVNLIVIPSSRKVYERAMDEGILQVFVKAGANVESSNCGPCFGSHMGVMSSTSKMISSSNRNYKGRMGSPDARIFLASPATVIASAIEGRLADPRKYVG